jgi:nucleoside-diphosphate kinase
MAMETTMVFLKPDAVQRGLVGRILSRFEDKGLRLVASKLVQVPRDLAQQHYAEHEGKPFFESLVNFVTSSPVLVLAIRGDNAVSVCRNLMGKTNGQEAAPGTIRGDFGMSPGYNLIHGSDSPESAARELKMWFNDDELLDYERSLEKWVYEAG